MNERRALGNKITQPKQYAVINREGRTRLSPLDQSKTKVPRRNAAPERPKTIDKIVEARVLAPLRACLT
jgi:hypothetical protein